MLSVATNMKYERPAIDHHQYLQGIVKPIPIKHRSFQLSLEEEDSVEEFIESTVTRGLCTRPEAKRFANYISVLFTSRVFKCASDVQSADALWRVEDFFKRGATEKTVAGWKTPEKRGIKDAMKAFNMFRDYLSVADSDLWRARSAPAGTVKESSAPMDAPKKEVERACHVSDDPVIVGARADGSYSHGLELSQTELDEAVELLECDDLMRLISP